MAYNGYLVKVMGNSTTTSAYPIPLSLIKAESYQALYSGQDLDSYRDTDGNLHRTALNNPLTKVEFNVRPLLTNTELEQFMSNIRSRYIDSTEKSVKLSVYVPELDDYITHKFYVPDITFTIFGVFGNVIKYNEFRVAFIDYGRNG